MEFIIEYWPIITFAIAVIVLAVLSFIKFVKSGKLAQLESVNEWLVWAVTNAEKELGSGTGQLKLRCVYDMFVMKFPWLAKIVTFNQFSGMVDHALIKMDEMLDKNEAVRTFVNGPTEE